MAGQADEGSSERRGDGSPWPRRGTAVALATATATLLAMVAATSAATAAASVPGADPVDGARAAFAAVFDAGMALLAATAGLLWVRRLADAAALRRAALVVAGAAGAVSLLIADGARIGADLFADPAGGNGVGILGSRSVAAALALSGAVLVAAAGRRRRPSVRQGIVLGLAVAMGAMAVETGLFAATIITQDDIFVSGRPAFSEAGPFGVVLVGARWGLAGVGVDAAAALLGAALALAVRRPPTARAAAMMAGLVAAAIGTLAAWNSAAPSVARLVRNAIDPLVLPGYAMLDFRLTGITTLAIVGPALLLLAFLWRRSGPAPTPVLRPAPPGSVDGARLRAWPVAPLLAATGAMVLFDAHRLTEDLGPVMVGLPSTVVWWRPEAVLVGLVLAVPSLAILVAGARRAMLAPRAILLAMLVMAVLSTASGGLPITVLARALALLPDVKSATVTPLAEELLKLLAIVLVVRALHRPSVRAGIIVGASAGLAFSLLEVAHYVQLAAATEPTFVPGTFALRLANGGVGLHVATASVLGAAVGWWRGRPAGWSRAAVPAVALVGAIATHAAWNLVSEGIANGGIAALDPGFPAAATNPLVAYAVGTAVTWVLAGPALLVAAAAWRRSGPTRPVLAAAPEPLPEAAGPASGV